MNCVSFIDLLTVTRTLKASAEMNAVYFQREFSDILPAAGGLPGLANFMYGSYTGIAMTMFMLIPSFAGMTEKTSVPEIAAAWERKDENAAAQGCCTLFRAGGCYRIPGMRRSPPSSRNRCSPCCTAAAQPRSAPVPEPSRFCAPEVFS